MVSTSSTSSSRRHHRWWRFPFEMAMSQKPWKHMTQVCAGQSDIPNVSHHGWRLLRRWWVSRMAWQHGVRVMDSSSRVNLDTTLPATQVGLRPVESGLWGHDGASGMLTTGSITHRSRSGNWDEWPGQIVHPSVVLPEKWTKSSVRNVKPKTPYVEQDVTTAKHRVTFILPVTMAENEGESVMDYVVCFDDASQWTEKGETGNVTSLFAIVISSSGFISHWRLRSLLR